MTDYDETGLQTTIVSDCSLSNTGSVSPLTVIVSDCSIADAQDYSHELDDYLPSALAGVDITLDLRVIRPSETLEFWGEKDQILHKKDNNALSVYTIDDDSCFYWNVYFNHLSRSHHGFIFDLWNNPDKGCGSERTFYVIDPHYGKTYVARFMDIVKSNSHAGWGTRATEIKSFVLRIEAVKGEEEEEEEEVEI